MSERLLIRLSVMKFVDEILNEKSPRSSEMGTFSLK